MSVANLARARAEARMRNEVRLAARTLDFDVYRDDSGRPWYRRVDTRKLNMSSMRTCVLGQLFGHFLNSRAVHLRRAYSRAFVPMPWQTRYVQACWLREIEARRLADAVGDASRYVPANPYLGALKRIPVT